MSTNLRTQSHGGKTGTAADGRQRIRIEQTVILTLFMVFLATCYGCRSSSPLAPKEWNRFHADGPNTSFTAIRSGDVRRPLWTVELGAMVYSSPVVGEDGTVYVGTLKGDIAAVNPDGSVKWKIPFSSSAIPSSPAVGKDGNIYVVLSVQQNNEDFPRAMLMSLNADGDVLWLYHFPRGSTTASPKPWTNEDGRTYIFLPVKISNPSVPSPGNLEEGLNELFVFDHEGNVINHKTTGGCVTLSGGGSDISFDVWNWLGDIWDFISSIGDPGEITSEPIHKQFGWLHATAAVVDYPNVTHPKTPLIVVADQCMGLRLTGFRWTPFGLLRLWTYEKSGSVSGALNSSPAVFPNGLLVLDSAAGEVMGFDAATGAKLWQTDIEQVVMATPVSVLGAPIYVVSRTHLHMFQANGELIKTIALNSETLASPALTADRIYVSTKRGLHGYSLDLTSASVEQPVLGGLSSPAVTKDGRLYLVTIDGQLRAYAIQ